MTNIDEQDLDFAPRHDVRHDPLMTFFVIGIMLLLLGCVFLALMGDRRAPAAL